VASFFTSVSCIAACSLVKIAMNWWHIIIIALS
jgi:hypothetical protein